MTVPPLPVLGDAALLFRFWDNVTEVPTDSRSACFPSAKDEDKKSIPWGALERLGDTWIKTISQEELPMIFGLRNYALVNFLTDHSNSNKFFDQVARHYELDRLVRLSPEKKNKKKGCADLFEAWIGCHVLEQRLYDQDDPLHELRHFLKRLWTLRYRELKVYVCHSSVNRTNILAGEFQRAACARINWPDDELLKKNLPSLIRATQNREIGSLITRTSISTMPLQEFIPFTSEAEDLTTFSIRNKSILSPLSLTTDFETPPYTLESNTQFRQYQIKCNQAVQKFLVSEDLSQQNICIQQMISECESWLWQLVKLPSQLYLQKTKVMLFWQLVLISFSPSNY